ncbi:CDP-alcohol phosphatidyltransferase family protein [Streptosporangium sp. NPDC023615]|uniref:CDP-alcohol phosphatidyltransferase family protein n=1 Tax=Streptosporangium sp. NPDC023615 TaxID=3154794 RepID=UPI0034443FA6
MPDPHATASSGTPRTVAVVLATTEASALPHADGTLLDRLTGQLAGLPVRDVHVVARSSDIIHAPGGTYMIGTEGSRGLADDLRRVAKAAVSSTGPVLVAAGDLVAHTEALALLVEHPSGGTAALVGDEGDGPGPSRPPVRTEGGAVVAAGTSFHRVGAANGTFRGALRVGVTDLAILAETAETLAELAETGRLGPMDGVEAPGLLLTGLVRSGVRVRAARLGRLRADRAGGRADAEVAVRRLEEVDEAKARLDDAVKGNDGFFATYAVSSWSRYLVRLAAELRLTPNAVTGMSVGLAVLAAVWFSTGTRPGMVAGAVLLYLSFVLDCVDGQLARYTRAFSPLGAWLDATSDRAKEYVVYVGLAFGYAAGLDVTGGGPDGIWALAVAALILQLLRHMIDFSYAGARADAARVRGALSEAGPGVPRSRAGDVRSADPEDVEWGSRGPGAVVSPAALADPADPVDPARPAGLSGWPVPVPLLEPKWRTAFTSAEAERVPASRDLADGSGGTGSTGGTGGTGGTGEDRVDVWSLMDGPADGRRGTDERADTGGTGEAERSGGSGGSGGAGVAGSGAGAWSGGAGTSTGAPAYPKPVPAPASGNTIVRLSETMEKASVTRWLKKIVVLPIGERMALIAVTAAFFNARVTFLALLAWGGVAMVYILAGRMGRSLSR